MSELAKGLIIAHQSADLLQDNYCLFLPSSFDARLERTIEKFVSMLEKEEGARALVNFV